MISEYHWCCSNVHYALSFCTLFIAFCTIFTCILNALLYHMYLYFIIAIRVYYRFYMDMIVDEASMMQVT
jgi:hypothetical protein